MKPEKMSGGDLALFEDIVSGENETWDDRLRGWLKKASAHIAALEAERDEMMTDRDMILTREASIERNLRDARAERDALTIQLQGARDERDQHRVERDALRDRVQALEYEAARNKRDWEEAERGRLDSCERVRALEAKQDTLGEHYKTACADASKYETALRTAESRLAAFRRRANDRDALVRVYRGTPETESAITAVARYIIGEASLPQSSTVEGVSNSDSNSAPKAPPEAFTHEKGLDADVLEGAPQSEPATDEAFATVEEALRYEGYTDRSKAALALSLLERRMGAMASVLGALLAYDANGRNFGLTRIIDMARAALTDAPPVFTLEEVRTAVFLLTLSQDTADRIAASLAALRRAP